MPSMHQIARALANEDHLELSQKGNLITDLDNIKGPYRMRNKKPEKS